MGRVRTAFVWIALATVIAVPLGAAMASPLLEWRDPIYIVAGFAGILAMALLFVQPLLAAGYLPGVSVRYGRRLHRYVGGSLVSLVVIHIAGLWFTSPPDVIDALLFVSPTPFAVWGVVAMWAIFASAMLVVLRRQLKLRPEKWRVSHKLIAVVIVVGSVVHAMLIEGTMETISKSILCALVLIALFAAVIKIHLHK